MKELIPIQIDETTTIYVEPQDDQLTAPTVAPASETQEMTRESLELDAKGLKTEALTKQAVESFAALQSTLRGYTKGAIASFKELGDATVEKVTLEFGVNLGGEAGVPYVTKGTAECSLKITVECNLAQ
ncbi:MAG: CU044_2847 family protein [Cyanobacteria bacterium P01_G01_bin.54]